MINDDEFISCSSVAKQGNAMAQHNLGFMYATLPSF